MAKILENLSKKFKRLSEDGKTLATQTLDKAEDLAATVVIKGQKIYDDWDIEKRATGATIGTKTAILLTWRAGPVVMKGGIIIGAFTGAALGPDGIDRFNDWVEKHRGKGNDNDDHTSPPDESTLDENTLRV